MLESVIKRRVVLMLEAAGWLVVHIRKPGWPDLEALKNGVTIFIETKQPGKTPRRLQEYVHGLLREQKFLVYIVTDERQLQAFKIA